MTNIVEQNLGIAGARSHLRATISELPGVFEGTPPERWFKGTARTVLTARKALSSAPPETQAHLQPIIQTALDLMRGKLNLTEAIAHNEIPLITDAIIMEMSLGMAQAFAHEVSPIPGQFVDIDTLVRDHPDQLRINTETEDTKQFKFLGIKHPFTQIWYDVPLPLDDKMWHKGGVARAVMDIHAGAPPSMLAAELPWNDLDVITIHDVKTARDHADLMGVEPSGVEVKKGNLDVGQFFAGRDTTQNMVALGRDGLHYSNEALQAAKTGHIRISSRYFPEKAIYNTDSFVFQDSETGKILLLPKQRGQMRLIKAVAEGKAISFDHMDVVSGLDFGIYALFLAKRWMNKPNFPELMQRMFSLLQQTGQVRDDETNVIDLLTRVHGDYPHFDFTHCLDSLTDVVTWKTKKLIKQIDREFARRHNLPSEIIFVRKPGDTQPRRIDLSGFKFSEEQATTFLTWWPEFLEQCSQRTNTYLQQEITPAERYFSRTVDIYREDCAEINSASV